MFADIISNILIYIVAIPFKLLIYVMVFTPLLVPLYGLYMLINKVKNLNDKTTKPMGVQ